MIYTFETSRQEHKMNPIDKTATMGIKGWEMKDLPDGICLEKSADLSGCGYVLLAPLLLATIVAFLDLLFRGEFFIFGIPVHWGEEKTLQPYVLFFLVAVSLAVVGREMQMRYASEKWIARQNSLEIHKGLWGLKFIRRYVNCELSTVRYERDVSRGEKPGSDACSLIIIPDSGSQFDLLFHGADAEQQALEFGQILSSNTGWLLFKGWNKIL
jgi:hypothetical protein